MVQYFTELVTVNLITTLTILTLIAAVVSALFARKTYRHEIRMTEPWSLTKVEGQYWMLERKHSKLATIYAEEVTPDYRKHQITLVAPTEDGFYRKGSKAVIKVTPSEIGSMFNLYYVEHRKKKVPLRFSGYRDDFSKRNRDVKSPPKRVGHWCSPLY